MKSTVILNGPMLNDAEAVDITEALSLAAESHT